VRPRRCFLRAWEEESNPTSESASFPPLASRSWPSRERCAAGAGRGPSAGLLRRLRLERIGIVYVTHRLDEVFRIADRVTVLRDGRRVTARLVGETSPSALVEAITGRKLEEMLLRPPEANSAPLVQVESLVTRYVGPVSFRVSLGEIVGLVGLHGAGHNIIGRAIFGDARSRVGPSSSTASRCAQVRSATPSDAASASFPRSAARNRSLPA
jgi:ribose transport system ATP-binding protein